MGDPPQLPSCSFLQDSLLQTPPADLPLLLASLALPPATPLPGAPGSGIWRTPAVQQVVQTTSSGLSPDLEFGDGVSAVFHSLSVTNDTPPFTSRPSPALSAASSPFVPQTPTIPIPLPFPQVLSSPSPQTIHINNFTANLNYHQQQYPGYAPTPNYPNYPNYQTYPAQAPGVMYVAVPQFRPQLGGGGGPPTNPGHRFDSPNVPGNLTNYPVGSTPMMIPMGQQQQQQQQQRMLVPQQQQVVMAQQTPAQAQPCVTFGSIPVVSVKTGEVFGEVELPHQADTDNKQAQRANEQERRREQEQKMAEQERREQEQQKIEEQERRREQEQKMQEQERKRKDEKWRMEEQEKKKKVEQEEQREKARIVEMEQEQLLKREQEEKERRKKADQDLQELTTAEDLAVKMVTTNTVTEETVAAGEPSPPQASKSWASLFSGRSSLPSTCEAGESSPRPTAVISPFTGVNVASSPGLLPSSLATWLRSYTPRHTAPALVPRGLTNRSNWCFVNAILQALLACPPLVSLLLSLPLDPTPGEKKPKVAMLEAMVNFVSDFEELEKEFTRPKAKGRGREVVTGPGLEATSVLNMLLALEGDTFPVQEGRQEDAEEFLTCLLNGLSDEMQELIKIADEQDEEKKHKVEQEEHEAEDWQEVGARGKSCVTRRVADQSQSTPLQTLALGMCRSCVKVEGKDNSATLQPFYTLQLDISAPNVSNISEALAANFAQEKLDGFICGKTKEEVEATRSLSLEELPPVLILHLKRFVYSAATGGVQKIMKPVAFPVQLEISKSVVSAECRAATTARHRQYRLTAVVNHTGREATKGHYVTLAWHSGYSCWLYCDDSTVTPTSEELVVQPPPSSTPYLLFYRRGDTLQ